MYNVNIHLPNGTIVNRNWCWIPDFDKMCASNFGTKIWRWFYVIEKSENDKDVWIEYANETEAFEQEV